MPPRMYSVEFNPKDVDQDTSTLMQLSHTRCPQGVEVLKRRHRMESPRQLITALPSRRRRRRPVAQRVLSIVRHVLGLLPYDPMRRIARQHRGASRARW